MRKRVRVIASGRQGYKPVMIAHCRDREGVGDGEGEVVTKRVIHVSAASVYGENQIRVFKLCESGKLGIAGDRVH